MACIPYFEIDAFANHRAVLVDTVGLRHTRVLPRSRLKKLTYENDI
jgi:hypothetical protein